MNHDLLQPAVEATPFWRSRYALGLLFFGAIATYFLLSEHRAHFLGALPYLLLLSCPLMHVFMHHGHKNHGGGQATPDSARDSSAAAGPRILPMEEQL